MFTISSISESDELDSDELVSEELLSKKLLSNDELDSEELDSDELVSDDKLDSEELDSDELVSDKVDLGRILVKAVGCFTLSTFGWSLSILIIYLINLISLTEKYVKHLA